jgi:hypothetical protein
MNPYIYTFIRDDLSHAQKIVQLGHATYEAGQVFEKPSEIASLVLLHANDETDLLSIAEKLDEKGIEYVMFYEPDISSYTAICTRPVYTKNERSFFKRWELYSHTV